MYEHTKGGEFTKNISSGKKGNEGTNYKWVKKGHRFFCHASPPCTHDRNKYLLSEIPPPRSPSPGGTSAKPKCHPHCTRLARPALKRPPSRQRDGSFCCAKTKKHICQKTQNQFIWAVRH